MFVHKFLGCYHVLAWSCGEHAPFTASVRLEIKDLFPQMQSWSAMLQPELVMPWIRGCWAQVGSFARTLGSIAACATAARPAKTKTDERILDFNVTFKSKCSQERFFLKGESVKTKVKSPTAHASLFYSYMTYRIRPDLRICLHTLRIVCFQKLLILDSFLPMEAPETRGMQPRPALHDTYVTSPTSLPQPDKGM